MTTKNPSCPKCGSDNTVEDILEIWTDVPCMYCLDCEFIFRRSEDNE